MMYKEIIVGNRVAFVDQEDFKFLNRFTWAVHSEGYAIYKSRKMTLYMHRLICPTEKWVDHINGNRLDNRKLNLRTCIRQENQRNRPKNRNNKSGYKGVTYNGSSWLAQIQADGKRKHLGSFTTKELAAQAYDEAAKLYHKEFACLNFKENEQCP